MKSCFEKKVNCAMLQITSMCFNFSYVRAHFVILLSDQAFATKLHPDLGIKNYYKSVAENKDVSKYVMMMSSAVSALKADILEALHGYSDYAFLWEKDRDEAVRVSLIG